MRYMHILSTQCPEFADFKQYKCFVCFSRVLITLSYRKSKLKCLDVSAEGYWVVHERWMLDEWLWMVSGGIMYCSIWVLPVFVCKRMFVELSDTHAHRWLARTFWWQRQVGHTLCGWCIVDVDLFESGKKANWKQINLKKHALLRLNTMSP